MNQIKHIPADAICLPGPWAGRKEQVSGLVGDGVGLGEAEEDERSWGVELGKNRRRTWDGVRMNTYKPARARARAQTYIWTYVHRYYVLACVFVYVDDISGIN